MSLTRVFCLVVSTGIVSVLLLSLVPYKSLQVVSAQEMRIRPNDTAINPPTTSIVERSHERVLMRRKRFLIFPKGANVICTLSMVKGMVFRGPRGYNLLAEVDYFYPLPDSPDALRPKKKKLKPATTTPAPTTPAPPPPPEHDHENGIFYDHSFNPDIFAPDSGWNIDPNLANLQNVPVPADVAHDRLWTTKNSQFDPNLFWRPKIPHNNYYSKGQPISLTRPPPPTIAQPQWLYNNYSPAQQQQRIQRPQKLQPSNYYPSAYPQGRSLKDADETAGTGGRANWTEHTDWEHFDAHRDRRDLYKSLEGMISGLNLQPCLLRTICEAQHFLLPKGQSLFHDIFKILFTLPVKEEFKDDYSDAMRQGETDCLSAYGKECPISILHMFLNSERVI